MPCVHTVVTNPYPEDRKRVLALHMDVDSTDEELGVYRLLVRLGMQDIIKLLGLPPLDVTRDHRIRWALVYLFWCFFFIIVIVIKQIYSIFA